MDFIAAEDTRVTVKLLNHLGLKKPMVSYHRHSGQGRSDELVARLLGGEDCALVTDAGTPAISDPGETGGPVRSAGDPRGGHSRGLRLRQCPGSVRPAHGAVYL